MLKPATVKHIKAFFESPTNEDSFINFNKAIRHLKTESGADHAWFCFWCFQNIQILDAGEQYWLSPGGFSFNQGVKCVSIRSELHASCRIFDLPIPRAEIRSADPAELYLKLGIEP
jgi:hypothetical protein